VIVYYDVNDTAAKLLERKKVIGRGRAGEFSIDYWISDDVIELSGVLENKTARHLNLVVQLKLLDNGSSKLVSWKWSE
jgi:hypothetical protein